MGGQNQYILEYFKRIERVEGQQANALASILIDMYHPKLVIDLGCGTGLYLVPFYNKGIEVLGIDVSKVAKENSLIPSNLIRTFDLCQPLYTAKHWDLCLCIETIEHIRRDCNVTVIDNICKQSNTIIFSGAHPKQGGLGHVNEQPKSYWIEMFKNHSFYEDNDALNITLSEIKKHPHCWWLLKNLIIQKKEIK